MRFLADRKFFTLWVGFGVPPVLFAAAPLAFRAGVVFGLLNLAVLIAWTAETFLTTCRRCPFYATANCGLPSLTVPLLLSRTSPASISLHRIRLHYYIDLAMILYINTLYFSLFPRAFPFVAIGSGVTLLIVYRAKRFHGLLPRLKSHSHTRAPFSLPILSLPSTHGSSPSSFGLRV